MHNIFAEEINKIGWGSNYDKIIEFNQFSRNICIYNKQKIKCKTEKTKCNNIIKQCKKWLTLWWYKRKHERA